LDGTTVDGNEAQNAGGGAIFFENTVLTITDATFSNNESVTNSGGGLLAIPNPVVTVTNSRFTGNTAALDGGGFWINGGASVLDRVVVTGNEAGRNGGGIITRNTTIRNSTFSGNTAGDIGGGIAGSTPGPFTVSNTTVSGNSAAQGGGIGTIGPLTLQNVTIAGNTATLNGGGLSAQNGASVSLANTLLGSNQVAGSPQNCAVLAGGGVTSAGGNLSQDPTCAAFTQPTDKLGVAAGLNATLANNGGPTMTHALLEGSAAINGGVNIGASTDQRGYSLIDADDIGAFEFGGTAPTGG
jgi:predicted outer membrane repeat protein